MGLICRYRDLTKLGTLYFGTWVDVEGTYFDTAHFADCLQTHPFKGGGCYLLLGRVEVDFSFPTTTVIKMTKMPFIPYPRFAADEKRAFDVHRQIREEVSMTHRKPYAQEHEIGLPRHRKL